MYVQSPSALRRIVLSSMRWPPTSIEFGRCSTAAATGYRRRSNRMRAALSAARSDHLARSVASRLPTDSALTERTVSRRTRRPDQAIALLAGASRRSRQWQYYHDIAFVHYWQLQDMEGQPAGSARRRHSPGPELAEPVAASMLVQGGDRASARFLLQQLQLSEEQWLRAAATRAAPARRTRRHRQAARRRAALPATGRRAILVAMAQSPRRNARHPGRSGGRAVRDRSRDW